MAKGDLISVRCYWGLIPYRHYGIDLGDGMVVHLATTSTEQTPSTKPSKSYMSVQRVTMEEFAEGRVIRYENGEHSLPVELVIARATGSIGQRGYHLVLGNCEHFARCCKYGQHESVQVKRVVKGVLRATTLGMTLLASRSIASRKTNP